MYETVFGNSDLAIGSLYATENKIFFDGYTSALGRELYEFTPSLVSVEDEEQQVSFHWMPNPVKDRITFSNSNKAPEHMQLTNILGQSISEDLHNNMISVSHLQAGNYILSYTIEGKQYRQMIIKE